MRALGSLSVGRDNNLNLLRMLAASLVLISHSFFMPTGDGSLEPLRVAYGFTLGSLAVDIFFVISGFLVTQSLLVRQDLTQYTAARVLRIWPGLIVMLVITVFVMGPLLTSESLTAYFHDKVTWKYLIKNTILLHGINWALPGVFTHNPSGAVNGSLWTLPTEVSMYIGLAVIWCVGLLAHRVRPGIKVEAASKWLLLLTIVVIGLVHLSQLLGRETIEHAPGRLPFMFCAGACAFLFRQALPMSGRVCLVLAIALVLGVMNNDLRFLAYNLCLPYIVLYLAYAPDGFFRGYNKVGDYSYGHVHLCLPGAAGDRGVAARVEAAADDGRLVPLHVHVCVLFLALHRKDRHEASAHPAAAQGPAPRCGAWSPIDAHVMRARKAGPAASRGGDLRWPARRGSNPQPPA